MNRHLKSPSPCRMKCVSLCAGMIGLCLSGGCGSLFPSLGGSVAGGRGTIQVAVINNTSNQAVFTIGTFDPADQNTQPDIVQFTTTPDGRQLLGGSTSSLFTLTCGRVLSVGSSGLLDAISQNLTTDDFDEEALIEGVSFGDVSDENGSFESIGSAAAFEASLGIDVSCNALVIFQLEPIPLGNHAFRIVFSIIPSSSDR